MGTVITAYNDRVRYTLQHKDFGSKVIDEPDGWKEDEKELARHETYHGIFPKFSNALKFPGEAGEFIQLIDDIYGINAELRLIKDERNPVTDLWERSYDGYLDMSTKETENDIVSIKFNSGGLEMLLKSRESETVEIERLDTMDGKPLPPIDPKIVELDGRRIFLQSRWEIASDNNTATATLSAQNEEDHETVGVPFKLVTQSHEHAQNVLPETTGEQYQGTNGIMFFDSSDLNRTFHLNFNLNFTTNVFTIDDLGAWERYRLCLTKYSGGTNYNLVSRLTLFDSDTNGGLYGLGGSAYTNILTGVNYNPKKNWNVTYEGIIDLAAGESLSLEFVLEADLGSLLHRGHLDVRAENMKGFLEIDEDSFYEKTTSKVLLAHEVADRLIKITTSQEKAFYSEYLGRIDIGYSKDGPGSYTGLAHGHWIRKFDKEPQDENNKYRAFSTSFRDFMTSFSSVWNVGLGIEKNGFSERIRIEDLSYFYNFNVTIKLPNQIKKVKRKVATEYYYSSLEFGYEQGGDYEEAMGLDEFNAISNFTTAIVRLKETYSAISKYRADAYGMEFARRKQKATYPTEDTRYDSDVFMLDLKPGLTAQSLLQRKWQDDFEAEPTGIFSPETATNLRFSPVNNLLRHGWVISAGLTKYPDEYIRYSSSTANSALKTKKIEQNEYAENGNIINADLKKPRYLPEIIEFEHEVTFEVNKMLQGRTTILNKEIPNCYGLVEFYNEKNQLERGFLINVKPNGNGKWEILKANR